MQYASPFDMAAYSDQGCTVFNPWFLAGHCAVLVAYSSQFKVSAWLGM